MFARLLRSGETGIVPSSFVELFTSESLLEKFSSLSEKVDSLRSERDEAQAESVSREKAAKAVICKVAELKRHHEMELAQMEQQLQDAHDKIDELTMQLSMLSNNSKATSPEPAAVSIIPAPSPRASLIRRPSSPELMSGSLESLMGALVRLRKKKKRN